MSARHRGSCLCGGVQYELDTDLTQVVMCHCGMCRKATGTAFATNAPVPRDRFHLTAGTDLLKEYESSPDHWRVFCGRCGSPIYAHARQRPGVVRIRLGALDTPVGRRPDLHYMVEFKADWDEITDTLPQYNAVEPARR